MMHPMTDYFYGERSDSREDIEQLNNMHSVALDDAEVSFPLSEEVRSYPEVATRSSNNFRPAILHLTRKRRNVWIVTALVGVILVVMIPAIIVSKRNRSERDTSNSFISDMVSESPPRPPIAAVIEYFLTESVTDASFFQDITSPQYKAARWLSEEDPANLSIPSVFTQHMDGYFYMFRYIMAINYFALGGEQWFHQLSFLSVEHVCRWNSGKAATLGVVCYKEDGLFVPVELILSSNNLKGEIPAENGLLRTLRGLDFGVNMLSGSIPASLCSLSGLKYMVLNRNLLTGSIPSCFGFLVALNELVLSDNDFEGSLPNELAQLEGLESLYLDDNRFSGNPSTVWNNLRNLTHLMANNNNFVSEIDINFLASNWELQWLDLSSNGFMSKGMFPDQLFRLSLEALDISDNRLTCDFHDTLPKNTDLKFLSLYHNKITGPLACLSMLEGLVHMDLSDNEIIGSMEPIGKLTSLKVLFLSENPFDAGPVPESFSKLTNLTELSLRSTRRTGTLPDLATSLRFVDLGYNSFTGSIPANYGDKSNLAYMLLNNNEQVTGELPSSLEGLTSLRGAFLHGTSLDSKTMNFLCMLQENQQQQESRQDAEDQVLWANCDTCSCQGCRCCDAALSTDCSQLPLDNIAGSWKNEFQRKKYTIMTAPQESSTRSGDGTRF